VAYLGKRPFIDGAELVFWTLKESLAVLYSSFIASAQVDLHVVGVDNAVVRAEYTHIVVVVAHETEMMTNVS
jgi:hypothetical protein